MTDGGRTGGPGLDYVLPLRWDDGDEAGLAELTGYLRRLARHARVIVVDGSPPPVFERHAAAWAGIAEHLRPDDDLAFVNGKVNGVVTGMRRARAERVVIADDDVRYGAAELAAIGALLGRADLVRPQNHFDPLPWHARWDTARTLLNRAFGADYPGTFGVRRSVFHEMGGYDGDVLFENLELIRTVRAHGGRECRPLGLYVRRLPPDPARFWSQRVRQAYDDLAQPVRLAAFLSVLPALAVALSRRRYGRVLVCAGLAVGAAETGRRRAGGRWVFPFSAALFAPVWLLERAVCAWLALAARLFLGGVPYAGRRMRTAAHSVRWIKAHRNRRTGRPGVAGAARTEASGAVWTEASGAGEHGPAETSWPGERHPAGELGRGARRGTGDPGSGAPSGGRLGLARGAEAGGPMRAVAEGLGRRSPAAAQRHRGPAWVDDGAVLGGEDERAPQ
ncbi:hypothetical protein GCM10010140_06940 [Streptosporangium pseudovulgare]|uniref:Glycosyltransferase 2-like domain-containing protein n=1 Tax=Streptosporangium pseudovulgare TaxID=35765 RepID=A0ABQ2QHE7_9ACTN|nr:hypothetical protein GCM10010140_06940 [Streptosporangium pseudovulgare]